MQTSHSSTIKTSRRRPLNKQFQRPNRFSMGTTQTQSSLAKIKSPIIFLKFPWQLNEHKRAANDEDERTGSSFHAWRLDADRIKNAAFATHFHQAAQFTANT